MVARLLMVVGAVVLLIGLILQYAPWLLGWFGRLPGDIRIEGEKTQLFIPITSMLLLSVLISLLIYILKRL